MKRIGIAQLWARWQSAIMTLGQPAMLVLAMERAPVAALTPLQRRLLAMGLAHANPSSLGRRQR